MKPQYSPPVFVLWVSSVWNFTIIRHLQPRRSSANLLDHLFVPRKLQELIIIAIKFLKLLNMYTANSETGYHLPPLVLKMYKLLSDNPWTLLALILTS